MMIEGKIIAFLLAIIGLTVGIYFYGEHRYEQGDAGASLRYGLKFTQLKLSAAADLAKEMLKTKSVEDAMADALRNQEVKDAESQTAIIALSNRIRVLAGPAVQLRDPNAAGCGGSRSSPAPETFASASAGPGDGAETGGLLSTQLTGLLQQLTQEADAINAAYTSCRADSFEVRVNDTSAAPAAPVQAGIQP